MKHSAQRLGVTTRGKHAASTRACGASSGALGIRRATNEQVAFWVMCLLKVIKNKSKLAPLCVIAIVAPVDTHLQRVNSSVTRTNLEANPPLITRSDVYFLQGSHDYFLTRSSDRSASQTPRTMATPRDAQNIAALLFRRELGDQHPGYCGQGLERGTLASRLESWREHDFLQHCSATYASFTPAPRSTIALCYNCDGTLLASTQ